MRICVTGAGGFIGRYVANRLYEEGHSVVGVGRGPFVASDSGGTPLRWVRSDLSKAGHPLADAGSLDCVIHLAGLAHGVAGQAARADTAAFMEHNCAAAIRVARSAARLGVQRFIMISSIAVYGEALDLGESVIDESTETLPRDPYGRSKLAAEHALSELSAQENLELVVIRPALVVGPGAPGNLRRLTRTVRSGMPLPMPLRDNSRSFVGISNLYDLLAKCMRSEKAVGHVFIAADDGYASTREVVTWIGNGLNKRPRIVPLPESVIKGMMAAAGQRVVFEKLYGNLRVTSKKARDLLSWNPRVPTEESFNSLGRSFSGERRG